MYDEAWEEYRREWKDAMHAFNYGSNTKNFFRLDQPTKETKMNFELEDLTNNLEATLRGLHGIADIVVQHKNKEIVELKKKIEILEGEISKMNTMRQEYWRMEERIEELEADFEAYQADIMFHLDK